MHSLKKRALPLTLILFIFATLTCCSQEKHNFPEINTLLKMQAKMFQLFKNVKTKSDLQKIKLAYIKIQIKIAQFTKKTFQKIDKYPLAKQKAFLFASRTTFAAMGSSGKIKALQQNMHKILTLPGISDFFTEVQKEIEKKTRKINTASQQLKTKIIHRVTANKFQEITRAQKIQKAVIKKTKKIKTAKAYFRFRNKLLKHIIKINNLLAQAFEKAASLSKEEQLLFMLAFTLMRHESVKLGKIQHKMLQKLTSFAGVKKDLEKLNDEYRKKTAKNRMKIGQYNMTIMKNIAN